MGQQQMGQSQIGQSQMGQSQMGQSQMGQSQMGQPQMGQPRMGQPQMGQPQMGHQQMGQPQMGHQQMGHQQMGYQQMGHQQMGQPQMGHQQMGHQQMGQSHTDINSSEDFQTRLNKLHESRKLVNIPQNSNTEFNPMKSPNTQNNSFVYDANNLNFNMGGKASGGRATSLQKKINSVKKTVANKLGLDHNLLLSMSADDIELFVQKTKNKKNTDTDTNENDDVLSTEKSDLSKSDNNLSEKRELLQMLRSIKKNKKNTENQDTISNDSIVKIDRKKKNISSSPKSQSDDEEPDKIVVKKKNKNSNSNNTLLTLNINVEDYCTDIEYYSDYLIDLEDKNLNKIKNIYISDHDFPKLSQNITSNSNSLLLEINNDEKYIELEEGTYEVESLLENLSEALNENNANINIKLDNQNKVLIENLDNDNFKLDLSNNSIGKLFGFKKINYENKSMYLSENECKLIDKKYYIYFSNIDEDEPFYEVYNNNIKNIKKINNTLANLNGIIVQFKDTDGNIIDFDSKKHNFKLNIEYENINSLKNKF